MTPMARHNAALLLSPVNGSQGGAGTPSQVDGDGGEVNDISSPSKEDELAAVLNSASKKKATTPTIGAIPSLSGPRKRKLPAEKDIYEIELSPERDGLTEGAYSEAEDEENPPKRVKRGKLSKKPAALEDGGKIKGQLSPKEWAIAAAKEKTMVENNQPLPKPRRGRPPKVQLRDTGKQVVDEATNEAAPESSAGNWPTRVENEGATIVENNRPDASTLSGEEADIVDPEPEKFEAAHNQLPSSSAEEHVVNLKTLEKILQRLRNVGHRFSYSNHKWSREKKETTLHSVAGQRLQKRLDRLNKTYQVMRALRAAEDNATLNQAYSKTRRYTDDLEVEVSKILTTGLGHVENKDERMTRLMLTDLYFNILPSFVEVLKNGVEVYSCDGYLGTPELEEVEGTIQMILNLAVAATKEPKEVEPTVDNGKRYQITQPTQQVIPELRQLQKNCRVELKSREHKEKIAKARKEAPERERLRKERQDLEEEERRKRNERKLRMQKETFLKNMNDPWMSSSAFAAQVLKPDTQYAVASNRRHPQSQGSLEQLFRRKTHTAEQVRILKSRLSEAEHLDQEANLAYERELRISGCDDESFENDDPEERVHLFGEKNNHAKSNTKDWSAKERTTLIDILRVRRGQPDLYEKLAEKLDRSMDEIFEKVKDFKEAMEYCREQGRFLEKEHDWINEI